MMPVVAAADGQGAVRAAVLRTALGQGGADRVTVILLRGFDRRAVRPSLVLMRRQGELLADVPGDVDVIALEAAGLWSLWLPLTRFLRRHRPDVLFSMDSGGNIPAVIAHLLAGRTSRLVLSERNVLFHGGVTAKRVALFVLKVLTYRLADRIAAVSEGVKRDLVALLRMPPDRISVVYNPVDLEEIARSSREPVDHPWFHQSAPTHSLRSGAGHVPVILGAGRLVREKGFDVLIEAFARVRAAVPARLVILGSGPLREALAAQAAARGVGDDVWFAGFDKNPFKYMARCAVFVLSSNAEGFPGVLIQAMACGVPVVATDCHAGPSEITRGGTDAFLVPVGAPAAMAEKIRDVLEHPHEAQGRAARAAQAVARFGLDRILPNYASLLSNGTGVVR